MQKLHARIDADSIFNIVIAGVKTSMQFLKSVDSVNKALFPCVSDEGTGIRMQVVANRELNARWSSANSLVPSELRDPRTLQRGKHRWPAVRHRRWDLKSDSSQTSAS